MDRKDRKAALAAYRERKTEPGVFALRCVASGEVWVGRAQDLPAIRNRIFFTLRQGANPHRKLQAAWNAHGEEGLVFEVLEILDPEKLELAFERELKDRHAHWMERLGATRL
ncbi:GIY-YIG nuclease family protein [Novosphingobium mangrovi (ex Huang et al. 2023)]|uniref:GIY-YIG nuclease family protein n=1 Tax=Novosphingobium mangrovi (ex Huang et al. 2023) TaxID=2976432 RepID=A0ABT2I8H9_9SPHN|nr:GIY-YIG nuclease family protein [Novosphingobium mangrovi (ex Huang et al. 2023)]MCT2401125.1 GIY-YIG nuclease family protein [Novosphingobium mangrovi (ex Huang et al. 2023)]